MACCIVGLAVEKLARVLIVGGSIAGMSCAIQLRKMNIAVDLVEIDPSWKMYGAGITITGPTMRALRTVGVLDEVLAVGATWNGAEIHDKSGRLLDSVTFPPLAADLPSTGGVMRPLLHKILSAKTLAAGAEVRLGVTVAAIDQTRDRVSAVFSDGTRGDYDLLIGADGIFSKTRTEFLPEPAKPVFTGQVVYRLVAERPPGFDRSHFFMGDDYKVGFNPVSATHMYMFLLHPAAANPWIDQKDQPQTLYDAMDGFASYSVCG